MLLLEILARGILWMGLNHFMIPLLTPRNQTITIVTPMHYLALLLSTLLVLFTNQVSAAPIIDVAKTIATLPKNYFPPGIDNAANLLVEGDPSAAIAQIHRTRQNWKRPLREDRAHYLESLAYLHLEDSVLALRVLEQSLQIRGSNSDALYLKGLLLDDVDKKLDAFSQAVLFNRFQSFSSNQALIEKIRMLIKKNATAAATVALEKTIATSPNFPEARIELAMLYNAKNRSKEGIALLRGGLAADPSNIDLKQELAKLLLAGAQRSVNKAQIEEATLLAGQVAQAKGPINKDSAALYTRALIESGKLTEAQSALDAALKGNANDPELVRMRTQLTIENGIAAQATAAAPASPTTKLETQDQE